jgi:hypothetical protein
MNKKIFSSLAILTIAVIVAFNVNLSTKKSNMTSLLALANVEALADGENGASNYTCINNPVYGGLGMAKLCSSCTWGFFISSYSSVGHC